MATLRSMGPSRGEGCTMVGGEEAGDELAEDKAASSEGRLSPPASLITLFFGLRGPLSCCTAKTGFGFKH